MPEKGLSVATYAAGASLATIALVYVFAPTYFIDNNPPSSSNPLSSLTSRKTGVVGLANAANDCFINSVLQALAGLGDLRIYLIRETHRRTIDDTGVYVNAVPQDAHVDGASEGGGDGAAPTRRVIPVWKIEGLQAGLVTKGLKEMIDMLNERPIYKKVITAGPFVRVLETAFRQRISRQQQDAQEFLQIVAERLCDEYHAGQRARQYRRRQTEGQATTANKPLDSEVVGEKLAGIAAAAQVGEATEASAATAVSPVASVGSKDGDKLDSVDTAGSAKPAYGSNGLSNIRTSSSTDDDDEEKGFPMEGKIESQIECLTCHFKPRPSEQTFCTLTLNVPQASSTSLSECFDMMLKTEYIDEFKCEKCRLVHAHEMLKAELDKTKSPAEQFQREATVALAELQRAIDTDPEHPSPSIVLPDVRYAPKRRIARHFRLVSFPKVLAIHLSRSIFDASNMSQKNSAKVSFPERLPLGGLLHRREYKLLSVVMHKGSHHSGHYESFRRQTIAAPYSNPNTFQPSQVYSPASTPMATTPRIGTSDAALAAAGANGANGASSSSPSSSTAELPPAVTSGVPSSPSSLGRGRSSSAAASQLPPAPTSAPRGDDTSGGDTAADTATGTATDTATDTAAETSSLRSVARSTLSKIASSSRSLSRTGSRHSAHKAAASIDDDLRVKMEKSKSKAPSVAATAATAATISSAPRPKKKKVQDRWWRISDEKVREASTREVLGMQREVYLLFYELERDPSRR
ncbi:ubiquitin c-terminal hydrolase [Ophiostoma piceae UAMH 11346]|uniref:Ubiquitin carboxyl-terminal hydrolase n=1 Tax=Ophiostoma piceae (strain UAMH 11346) TaxID=1262450 RepID=S3D779_OPHP1|nr:ubiquitin c-terminal hydrolase [Ophiostoma piceae UAMH 11346]